MGAGARLPADLSSIPPTSNDSGSRKVTALLGTELSTRTMSKLTINCHLFPPEKEPSWSWVGKAGLATSFPGYITKKGSWQSVQLGGKSTRFCSFPAYIPAFALCDRKTSCSLLEAARSYRTPGSQNKCTYILLEKG